MFKWQIYKPQNKRQILYKHYSISKMNEIRKQVAPTTSVNPDAYAGAARGGNAWKERRPGRRCLKGAAPGAAAPLVAGPIQRSSG